MIILPDNDEVGRRHANQVANAIHGLANNVRIVELPNLEDHGDVSDFLDKHSIEEFLSAVEKAQPYELPTLGGCELSNAELLEWDAPILPSQLNTPNIPASI